MCAKSPGACYMCKVAWHMLQAPLHLPHVDLVLLAHDPCLQGKDPDPLP